jgi:excisionase family DNA binding protein
MSHQSTRSVVVAHNPELEALTARLGLIKPSYSRRETAAILGVSESGIDRLLRAGRLPSFQVGERIIILRNDIAAFLHERQRGQPSVPEPPPPQEERPSRRHVGRPRKVRKDAGRGA